MTEAGSALHNAIDVVLAVTPRQMVTEGVDAFTKFRTVVLHLQNNVEELNHESKSASMVFGFLIDFCLKKHLLRKRVAEVVGILMASPSWAKIFHDSATLKERAQDLPDEVQVEFRLMDPPPVPVESSGGYAFLAAAKGTPSAVAKGAPSAAAKGAPSAAAKEEEEDNAKPSLTAWTFSDDAGGRIINKSFIGSRIVEMRWREQPGCGLVDLELKTKSGETATFTDTEAGVWGQWIPVSIPCSIQGYQQGEKGIVNVKVNGIFASDNKDGGGGNYLEGRKIYGAEIVDKSGSGIVNFRLCVVQEEEDAVDGDCGVDRAPYKWVKFSRGDPVPEGAVLAGWTKNDGEVYVARNEGGEPGKLNHDNGKCWNLWCHKGGDTQSGEALCLKNGSIPRWETCRRGDRKPEGAVYAGHTREDGPVYVGRHSGVCGKVNIESDDTIWNFWVHTGSIFNNGRSSEGDVLCLDVAVSP